MREALELDEVCFVPAAEPPHKPSQTVATGRERLEMVELAIAGQQSFRASDIELRRDGPSYTVDTLRALRADHPEDQLVLLLGADALSDLPSWRDPEEVIRLSRIAVATRPGHPVPDPSTLSPPIPEDEVDSVRERIVEIPRIGISSTDIRERLARGRSIRYLTPPAVVAYVEAQGLYRTPQVTPS